MARQMFFTIRRHASGMINLRHFRSLPRQMRARSVWALESAVAFGIGPMIKEATLFGGDRFEQPGPQASLDATSLRARRRLEVAEAL